jgi:hypothetical protein
VAHLLAAKCPPRPAQDSTASAGQVNAIRIIATSRAMGQSDHNSKQQTITRHWTRPQKRPPRPNAAAWLSWVSRCDKLRGTFFRHRSRQG